MVKIHHISSLEFNMDTQNYGFEKVFLFKRWDVFGVYVKFHGGNSFYQREALFCLDQLN